MTYVRFPGDRRELGINVSGWPDSLAPSAALNFRTRHVVFLSVNKHCLLISKMKEGGDVCANA